MSIFETFDPAKSLGQQVKNKRKKPATKRTQIGLEDINREKAAARAPVAPIPSPTRAPAPEPDIIQTGGVPDVQRELPQPIEQTVSRPVPSISPAPSEGGGSGPSPEDVRSRIAAEERDAAIRNLKAAFGKTERSLEAEREALDPMFLQQRGDIRTQDVFARRRADVSAATGGLSNSGAASQADLQQNVLTQGAMSTSRQQEADLRANINRRLTEAEALMNRGIADATTAAEVRALQSQLTELENAQNARIESARLEDERAYDMQVLQLKNMNDQEMSILESRLDREEKFLDAEIQNARDNRLFEQEQSLLAQKASINAQQAAVEAQLRRGTDAFRSGLELNEIEARGQQDRLTRGAEAEENIIGEDTYAAAIEKAESDALSQGRTPEQARVQAATELVNLAIQQQDNMSEQMFNKLMLEYGITEADIYRATNGGL